MAHIKKRQNKGGVVFGATVRVAGYPSQSATFKLKADALAWAGSLENDMRLGRHHPEGVARKYTLTECIDKYLEQQEVLSQTKRPAQRVKFLQTKRLHLGWWKKEIGDTRLANVTPSLVNDARMRLFKSGRKRKQAATVNRYMADLSHCLSTAMRDWGWLKDNPLRTLPKLKEPRGRVRFLSDAEREALLEACRRQKNSPLYAIVVLAICTGARKSELLNLKWQDVDFERGMITLNETKNGERATLHLRAIAPAVLKEHRTSCVRGRKHVFSARLRDMPRNIENEWRRALGAAKLGDFRFHDLRHCTASYLAANGASTSEIAEILRHKTLNMVKRYAHLTESHTGDVVERMNNKIFGKVEE